MSLEGQTISPLRSLKTKLGRLSSTEIALLFIGFIVVAFLLLQMITSTYRTHKARLNIQETLSLATLPSHPTEVTGHSLDTLIYSLNKSGVEPKLTSDNLLSITIASDGTAIRPHMVMTFNDIEDLNGDQLKKLTDFIGTLPRKVIPNQLGFNTDLQSICINGPCDDLSVKNLLNKRSCEVGPTPRYDSNENIVYLDNGTNIPVKSKNDIIIMVESNGSQDININNYFANSFEVNWDATNSSNYTNIGSHTYTNNGTHYIVLHNTDLNNNRWQFRQNNGNEPTTPALIPQDQTTVTNIQIVYMPSLYSGFGNTPVSPNSWDPGDYFFANFNYKGAIIGFPNGSFDTSDMTHVTNYLFYGFNQEGALNSLPECSFNLINILITENHFFEKFNYKGSLTYLPQQSFNINNISSTGDYFFAGFNRGGSMVYLPSGSFYTNNITTVGDYFFTGFNRGGSISYLPSGSFNISGIVQSRQNDGRAPYPEYFFSYFSSYIDPESIVGGPIGEDIQACIPGYLEDINTGNQTDGNGNLMTLPPNPDNLVNITVVNRFFFVYFNCMWHMMELPGSINSDGQLNGEYPDYNSMPQELKDLLGTLSNPSFYPIPGLTAGDIEAIYSRLDDGDNPDDLVAEYNLAPQKYSVIFGTDAGIIVGHFFVDTNDVKKKEGNSIIKVRDGNTIKEGDFPIPKGNQVKSGYSFAGWYTQLNGGTKLTGDLIVEKNLTYYAHWEEKNCIAGTTLNPITNECEADELAVETGGIVRYWDMKTTKIKNGRVVIRGLSQNPTEINLACYNGSTRVNCNNNTGGPQMVENGLKFNGTSSRLRTDVNFWTKSNSGLVINPNKSPNYPGTAGNYMGRITLMVSFTIDARKNRYIIRDSTSREFALALRNGRFQYVDAVGPVGNKDLGEYEVGKKYTIIMRQNDIIGGRGWDIYINSMENHTHFSDNCTTNACGPDNEMYIGSSTSGNTDIFNGVIHTVITYNYELSDNEVKTLLDQFK